MSLSCSKIFIFTGFLILGVYSVDYTCTKACGTSELCRPRPVYLNACPNVPVSKGNTYTESQLEQNSNCTRNDTYKNTATGTGYSFYTCASNPNTCTLDSDYKCSSAEINTSCDKQCTSAAFENGNNSMYTFYCSNNEVFIGKAMDTSSSSCMFNAAELNSKYATGYCYREYNCTSGGVTTKNEICYCPSKVL